MHLLVGGTVTVRKDVNRRVAVAAAVLATGALVLTGCSAGQHSQTASMVAAVNGNSATAGNIDLRGVKVLAPSGGDYTNVTGGSAILTFVAANSSASETIKLTKITTPIGTIDLDATDIKPGAAIAAAAPGSPDMLGAKPLTVVVKGLTQNVVEGPSYKFTFQFSDGTSITISAPVDSEGHDRFTPPKDQASN